MTEVAAALEAIKSTLGERGWLAAPDDIAPYMVEQRGLYRGSTLLVVRPASTEALSRVVTLAIGAGIAIVPQGGNTGLCGGGVPPAERPNLVIALGRMNRIRAIDLANDTLTVEAGCILADIQREAAARDRLFPISLGAEGSCQIGGNIATNAGGVQVLRYGNMREQVLGLEVVLPDGRVWHGLRGLRKDNTGYDLKQLFIGSEGTLGIVTAATLKLYPKPQERSTAILGLGSIEAAMQLFQAARGAVGDRMTAFELMPRIGIEFALRHTPSAREPLRQPHAHYVLIETASPTRQSGLADALEAVLGGALEDGTVADGAIAASAAQAGDFWRLREGLVLGQRHEGGSIKHDVSVPVSAVAAFIARASEAVTERLPGIRPVAFGHVGDGNIHFNLSQPLGADTAAFLARWGEFNRIVHDIVAELGGSISAEHGIGRLKTAELRHYKAPLELELMARIKHALDPQGVMNPGKILSETGA